MKRIIGVILLLVASSISGFAQSGELHFCLRSEPKTFNPILVADEASDTVRYLTGGVLVRVNRVTQQLQPELAMSWKVSKDGRSITFKLREKVYFSDGTPFSADDVAYTVKQMMDPAMHSPTGDAFRSGPGSVEAKVISPKEVMLTFPAPVAGLDRQFDQVAIMSAKSPKKEMAVLGAFYVADHKPGSYVLLNRNTNFWKKDAAGKQLPYLNSVRLEIQANRDIETMKLRRGEIDLINSLDSEFYERLRAAAPEFGHDAGPSLDTEQMWFNQVAKSPIPAYKKAWFRSTAFRRAMSDAINRADLCRVAFSSRATPAIGPISPTNKFWFNSKLKAQAYDPAGALKRLQSDGFRQQNGKLVDRDGNAVEFSIITNAGNKYRERMATLIQQDLGKIGIQVNVVTLDFPSLIERITETFNYEAAMLGLVNTDLDPNGQMNVWLSSSDTHQWNPKQASPETPWEAELDRLIRAQAQSMDPNKRKQHFDRLQEIVYEQAPFIYLVNKNAMSAYSTSLTGMAPSVLRPQTFWNIESIAKK
jgi:peptide/nickel transport system substrate-binding protein